MHVSWVQVTNMPHLDIMLNSCSQQLRGEAEEQESWRKKVILNSNVSFVALLHGLTPADLELVVTTFSYLTKQ